MYPENDDQFEETTVASVRGQEINRADGWVFYCPESFTPKVGQVARFYGKGIGYTVRGLFLDGEKVFYRTEEEERAHHTATTYGADIKEWLARWDAGKSVWSIEMGGFGPGYEQALQITVVEVVRFYVNGGKPEQLHAWSLEKPILKDLGLSGSQYGAAAALGRKLFEEGPQWLADQKRTIQVCRDFPGTIRKEYPE